MKLSLSLLLPLGYVCHLSNTNPLDSSSGDMDIATDIRNEQVFLRVTQSTSGDFRLKSQLEIKHKPLRNERPSANRKYYLNQLVGDLCFPPPKLFAQQNTSDT
jgi:hypothetical protein